MLHWQVHSCQGPSTQCPAGAAAGTCGGTRQHIQHMYTFCPSSRQCTHVCWRR
jgi:hypothetical protein